MLCFCMRSVPARRTGPTAFMSPSLPACQRRSSPAPAAVLAVLEQDRRHQKAGEEVLMGLPLFSTETAGPGDPDPLQAALDDINPDLLSPEGRIRAALQAEKPAGGDDET